MHWGLLWYDQRPVADAIAAAAARYTTRFGQPPNVCYVHPALATVARVNQVQVRASPWVLKSHFWIGVEAVA